jgi:mono/diheme cytochrome c family protein
MSRKILEKINNKELNTILPIRYWILLLLAPVFFYIINGCSEEQADKSRPKFIEMSRLREELKQKLGTNYDLPIPPATVEQLARGKALYQIICSPCHGNSGKPPAVTLTSLIVPPADLSHPDIAHFFSDQARLEIIRNGIGGTPMKGLDGLLSEEDTVAVFMHTRTLIKQQRIDE